MYLFYYVCVFFLCRCTRYRPERVRRSSRSWEVNYRKLSLVGIMEGNFINFSTAFRIIQKNRESFAKKLQPRSIMYCLVYFSSRNVDLLLFLRRVNEYFLGLQTDYTRTCYGQYLCQFINYISFETNLNVVIYTLNRLNGF